MANTQTQLKHTPGPWEFSSPTMAGNDRVIVEAHGFGSVAAISLNGAPRHQSRLDVTSPYYQAQLATMEANARLIAAAPELLEACRQANDLLNDHFGIDDSDDAGNAVHDAIRAAIAKATN